MLKKANRFFILPRREISTGFFFRKTQESKKVEILLRGLVEQETMFYLLNTLNNQLLINLN